MNSNCNDNYYEKGIAAGYEVISNRKRKSTRLAHPNLIIYRFRLMGPDCLLSVAASTLLCCFVRKVTKQRHVLVGWWVRFEITY